MSNQIQIFPHLPWFAWMLPLAFPCGRFVLVVTSTVLSRQEIQIKGTTSPFVHLEKLSLNFSSSSFAIRINLLHP